MGSGGTFIARSIDTEAKHLSAVVRRAYDHKGASFVEILQNCPIYNDGIFEQVKDKKISADFKVELEHGEPLVFGKEREKGVRLNRQRLTLEVIDLNSGDADGVLIHDETNKVLAQMLATMSAPELPVAVGVIYREDRATYDEVSRQQVALARNPSTSLQELLHSGHTWVVE